MFLCTSITLFSFTNTKINNAYVNDKELVIEDGLVRKFSYDNAIFYNLIAEDKNYGYRIIFDGHLETFIEMTLETKLLRGILDEKPFSIQLDETNLELLINKCEENKLTDDNSLWWKLYEIRDNFYKKTYRPNIMPSSSNYVSDYELEKMTSTDYYLDNYELQRYGGKTAKKYEEGIVNIIPKAWFFDVGEHIYYGTEYIIYADTIVINEDTMWKNTYWKTEVYVFDIDRTKIGSSQVLDENQIQDFTSFVKNGGYNIIIDVAIRNVYYGLDYDKSTLFYNSDNLDKTKEQIVVNGYAIDKIDIYPDRPSPIFLNMQNIQTSIDINSLSVNECNIDQISYKLIDKVNNFSEEENEEEEEYVTYVSEEIALTALGAILGQYGIILDILNIVGEGFKYILPPNEANYDDISYSRQIAISDTGDLNRWALISLPNNIMSLIDNHVYDYKYHLKIMTDCDVYPNKIEDYKIYFNSAFHIQLYDINGNIINNGEHNYKYNDSSYLRGIKYADKNGIPYSTQILLNDYLDNTIFIARTSGINIIRTAPNTFVMIADIYGRVIANSKNPYGNSEYVIANLEEGKYYYAITGYNNQNKTGSYSLNYYSTPSTLSPNSNMTITNYNDTMSLIYKYVPGSIPCKLNVFTHSYQDTNIAIYNSKGQFIAGNDDAYYDPDEDNSDYNAGCEIGLMTSETYYIIINSITRNTLNYRIEIVVNEAYD